MIPNDPERRWWVEVGPANPMYVDSLRQSLVFFLAFRPGKEPVLVGTGFIIAGDGEKALILTAKHIFEGIGNVQRHGPLHAPSALFRFSRFSQPSIDPERLQVGWIAGGGGEFLHVFHVEYNDTLDLALVVVGPGSAEGDFRPASVLLRINPPKNGDIVHLISSQGMEVAELSPPEPEGVQQVIAVRRPLSVRVGVVTGVYVGGYRQYKWPCFTTSIPTQPGSSGGFVRVVKEGEDTVAACGIVCADNSPAAANWNAHECGDSIIAMSWTALGLSVPEQVPSVATTSKSFLIDCMYRGDVPRPIGTLERVTLHPLDGGEYAIELE